MHRAHRFLGQFQSRKNGTLGAANAHAGWPSGNWNSQYGLHFLAPFGIAFQPCLRCWRYSAGFVSVEKIQQTFSHDLGRVFTARRQHVFAMQRRLQIQTAQHECQLLLYVFWLSLFQQKHSRLVFAKINELSGHQRISHIQDQNGQA